MELNIYDSEDQGPLGLPSDHHTEGGTGVLQMLHIIFIITESSGNNLHSVCC